MSPAFLPLCHKFFMADGSFYGTLFMAGVLGSATHCTGMCGPFVLSQTTVRLKSVSICDSSIWKRMQGAALLPYHLGRMTTYTLLGVIAAALAMPFRAEAWFHDISAVMLFLAAFIFLASALKSLSVRLPLPSWPDIFLHRMGDLFENPEGTKGYALGVVLGLLPCGLVYAAMMAAAAQGNVPKAALGMVAFAFGTMPALMALALGGRFMFQRFQQALRFAVPVLMIFSSLTLFFMAGDMIR
jgi:sulfite exporter TauE/SafE